MQTKSRPVKAAVGGERRLARGKEHGEGLKEGIEKSKEKGADEVLHLG